MKKEFTTQELAVIEKGLELALVQLEKRIATRKNAIESIKRSLAAFRHTEQEIENCNNTLSLHKAKIKELTVLFNEIEKILD